MLESVCVEARGVAEVACGVVIAALGVVEARVPSFLGEDDRVLRRGLRAKSRQLGDVAGSVDLLVAECAFEQWHRLLFARFLAENGLLIHPEFGAPVSIVECGELAEGLGEPDGWSVAARFAAEILPGIFRLDDPCVQLRLAPEGRLEIERLVAGLPAEIFLADDALGWVYQYWQKDKKDEVNASERKIGGADLGPVTQLFTENYMVRFLLENSLGAWWAARHPDSPLLKDWEYLRFDDDGAPAAGGFNGWPDHVGDVTVMDPCCGSGHFLVEAFEMLWQMRVEEEGLDPVAAQDAVLRDNLFGLELDPRCVQIAMFAVALQAWKTGGGWRELPTPNIACSGIPVKAPVEEWKALADGDQRLENALVRLHILFRDADTLGSLIDPKRAIEITDSSGLQTSFEDVDWDEIAPLLSNVLSQEKNDPAIAVLGADAAGIARATNYLSRQYTLVATNVPYLKRANQSSGLRDYLSKFWQNAQADLATGMQSRWEIRAITSTIVSPQNWLTGARYRAFRENTLFSMQLCLTAWLGAGSFRSISGEVVQPILLIMNAQIPSEPSSYILDVSSWRGADAKAVALRHVVGFDVSQQVFGSNPDQRILPAVLSSLPRLDLVANAWQGIASSDYPRFGRYFWETPHLQKGWRYLQSTVGGTCDYGGRDAVLFWEDGYGSMTEVCQRGASFRGKEAWGRRGVVVSQMGELSVTIFTGECFDNNTAVLTLENEELLPAVWAFASSHEFSERVREIDQGMKVTNSTFVKVPFDVDRWREVAAERFPDGLPVPWSDDPTQWLFEGRPEVATEVLQVGVGRLLGFRWPEQADTDDIDGLADSDGVVCLPSVRGEATAEVRLRELLARAFDGEWSAFLENELLEAAGSKKNDLGLWLRDEFFKAHCKVFKNRPFVWHVWDGRKDGFSALVNYHKLDRSTLERLTYTYLGDWIERQTAGYREDVAGAEQRLAAAQDLQHRLELILEGEPPYDVFVRWKDLGEQAVGWDPDLNDGVRLNVRPFVEAGVLRNKFNVHWKKDRGKNPDGSGRFNDLQFTLAEKHTARQRVNL